MTTNWLTAPAYLKTVLDDAPVALAATKLPEPLANWLTRLRLLYGVPFNVLVPDSRLLPVESIRFFYIDRNFTDRLVDGALSVGKTTTREFTHAEATNNAVRQVADDEERVLRTRFRSKRGSLITRLVATQPADLTGLLLRSRAVSGWPGLEVKAYRNITQSNPKGTPLSLLRMDRLAPDVLLCLFEGVPTRVDIEEPREGIQFGVNAQDDNGDGVFEPSPAVPSGMQLDLRQLKEDQAGHPLAPNRKVAVPVRRGNRRVLHTQALHDLLRTQLAAVGTAATDPGAELTAGELALQLWQPPFRQRFEGNGSAGGFTAHSQYLDAFLKVELIAEPLKAEELVRLFPQIND